jgi:hypothetical protein
VIRRSALSSDFHHDIAKTNNNKILIVKAALCQPKQQLPVYASVKKGQKGYCKTAAP